MSQDGSEYDKYERTQILTFTVKGGRSALINLKKLNMLRWTVTFIVLAIIAAIFGFGGIAAGAASIAKVLFFIFLIAFVISLITGRKRIG